MPQVIINGVLPEYVERLIRTSPPELQQLVHDFSMQTRTEATAGWAKNDDEGKFKPTHSTIEKFKRNLAMVPDAGKLTLDQAIRQIALKVENKPKKVERAKSKGEPMRSNGTAFSKEESTEEVTDRRNSLLDEPDPENLDLPPLPSSAVANEVNLGSTPEIRRKLHMAAVRYGLNVEAVLKLRLYIEPTKKSFAEEMKKQRADEPPNKGG